MFKKLLNYCKTVIPKISETERIALNSGTVSIDKDIFNGFLDKKKLIRNYNYPRISQHSIINNSVHNLCKEIDDYNIYENKGVHKSEGSIRDYVKLFILLFFISLNIYIVCVVCA